MGQMREFWGRCHWMLRHRRWLRHVTLTHPLLSSPPHRAATLVRKTKGENKMGRSHPLRCGRQRWYGGNQGMGTRGRGCWRSLLRPPAPHTMQRTTVGHDTRHPPPRAPPPPTTLLTVTHFLPSRARCLLFLLGWTDLCMPLLDPTVGSV